MDMKNGRFLSMEEYIKVLLKVIDESLHAICLYLVKSSKFDIKDGEVRYYRQKIFMSEAYNILRAGIAKLISENEKRTVLEQIRAAARKSCIEEGDDDDESDINKNVQKYVDKLLDKIRAFDDCVKVEENKSPIYISIHDIFVDYGDEIFADVSDKYGFNPDDPKNFLMGVNQNEFVKELVKNFERFVKLIKYWDLNPDNKFSNKMSKEDVGTIMDKEDVVIVLEEVERLAKEAERLAKEAAESVDELPVVSPVGCKRKRENNCTENLCNNNKKVRV
jgi:hypothetical protein